MRAMFVAIRNTLRRVLIAGQILKRNARGSFGVMTAILLPCIIVAAGLAVDLSRLLLAKNEAQGVLDAAVLAAASSGRSEGEGLKNTVNQFLKGPGVTMSDNLTLEEFTHGSSPHVLSASARGSFPTTFMRVANIDTVSFSVFAEARWATEQAIEVAMVLDNTWSMNGEKLKALKKAATKLVDILEKNKDPDGDLKVGLVPYADYVNVGMYNRFRTWLSVPDEYTTPRSCELVNTANVCERGDTKTCFRTVDGLSEAYDCTPYRCTKTNVRPYERCVGGEEFTWHGCVGSRTSGTLRLNDTAPNTPYPGILSPTKNCLDPIVPLTGSLTEVRRRISGMVVQAGSYKPSTYIPAGLIWGVNILSQPRPFSEGAAYDENNKRPRKVLVLMTDGANTMTLDKTTGKHVTASGWRDLKETYADMQSICDYARSKKIDVYTIAFLVEDGTGQDAMRNCASSSSHAFDARNADELDAAFSNIGASLATVTLTN